MVCPMHICVIADRGQSVMQKTRRICDRLSPEILCCGTSKIWSFVTCLCDLYTLGDSYRGITVHTYRWSRTFTSVDDCSSGKQRIAFYMVIWPPREHKGLIINWSTSGPPNHRLARECMLIVLWVHGEVSRLLKSSPCWLVSSVTLCVWPRAWEDSTPKSDRRRQFRPGS